MFGRNTHNWAYEIAQLQNKLADVEGRVRSLRVENSRLEEEVEKLKAQTRVPQRRPGPPEYLPVLDRVHELALVAQGHADLAREFGLISRQREASLDDEDAGDRPDEFQDHYDFDPPARG